jgi:hypothetical protein
MDYIVIVEIAAHDRKSAVVIYEGNRYFVAMGDLYLAYDDKHYSIYRGLLNQDSFIPQGYDTDISSLASMI